VIVKLCVHIQCSTSLPCSWLPPSYLDQCHLQRLHNLSFHLLHRKRKHLSEPDSSFSANDVQQTKKRMLQVSKPNEEDKDAFLKELSQSGSRSLVAGYNDTYIPLYEAGKVMKISTL